MKIIDLYLSLEKESASEEKMKVEYTDVVVTLDDGKKYIASFFAYGSINKLRSQHQKNGFFLGGKYFRAENMVLIETCTDKLVNEVVNFLIAEGDFKSVFKLISIET